MEINYPKFEQLYDKAVEQKNRIFEKHGHDSIKAAFPADSRTFDPNNWNDPLMSILRNTVYDNVLMDTPDYPIKGTIFHEDDQHTVILEGNDMIYGMSWYKNRGKTEELYQISQPRRAVSLSEIYEFFMECEIDIMKIMQE